MSLIICNADYPNLPKLGRISRNYAKDIVSESVFSGKKNLAFFSGLDAEKSVAKSLGEFCVIHADFIYLVIGVSEVPPCLFGSGLVVGHEQV